MVAPSDESSSQSGSTEPRGRRRLSNVTFTWTRIRTSDMSQSLGESPFRSRPGRQENLQEVYNERHRLALEVLVSGGRQMFLTFLQDEKIQNFLSDEEIQVIRGARAPPRCASFLGDEPDVSADCSSVTYFPEMSDVEPPVLENGWPAFTSGSYRGATRAVAHFQPGYGENIYGCKEAALRLIRSAREVIAIVTDSLTDLDVFRDLREACCARRVPVYILLDQLGSEAFLKMCQDVGVCLDDLPQMRVRTIAGSTYYMRSGARITGKVHERFMLIDGTRVATGSYRFNWTDGKLNSSNLIELSGQIVEKFDEQFRVLYAHSLPLTPRGSVRNMDQLLSPSCPTRARPEQCLTSTPSSKQRLPPCDLLTSADGGQTASVGSNQSTIGEDWCEEKEALEEEVLAGGSALEEEVLAGGSPLESKLLCHMSSQTSWSDAQTDPQNSTRSADAEQNSCRDDDDVKECIQKLSQERRQHINKIRSKVENMMSSLSRRRGLADVTNTLRGDQDCGPGSDPGESLVQGQVC